MLTAAKFPFMFVGAVVLSAFMSFGPKHLQPLTLSSQLASIGNGLAWSGGESTGLSPSAWQSSGSGQNMPAAQSLSCQQAEPDGYQKCRYTDEFGQTMSFFLHVPALGGPLQKYPLVLVLHGGGERASPGMTPAEGQAVLVRSPYVKCWVTKAAHLDEPSVQSRWPSFIVVPQLGDLSRWVDVPPGHGSYQLAPRPTEELRMAKEVVDLLRQKYGDVDSNRLYITGISLGGYGTWDAIERWPNYFAAAVPVSGAGDPSRASELKDLPIWVFHGAGDPIVPVSGSRDMVQAILAAGGQPRYTEYAGAKHDIWARAYAVDTTSPSASLFQWLFSQHKGPANKLARRDGAKG